ncbi:MAG TPA: aspartate kinase [Nitrososphaerales archaeon]|nr:aspartate kinase [Nitrososphaerales archaeon]
MKIKVMKFGGSLVASPHGISRIADLVVRSKREGSEVVAVVSALGEVTELLLQLAQEAVDNDTKRIAQNIAELRLIHTSAIGQTSLKPEEKRALNRTTGKALEELKRTLLGVSALGELSPRSRDLILSFGERLSAPILAAEIEGRRFRAPSLTGGEAGIVTDRSFGEAIPNSTATNKAVKKSLLARLAAGEVPVVAGFIARSTDGEVTTLGRGGSDYSATLLGAALKAEEVWIWTDVDGILSADPRIVKGSAPVKRLSYPEAEELAFFGAKNMHPLALGPARTNRIPVRIKNGFRPDFLGTLITDRETKREGIIKAVAVVRNVGLLTVAGETLQGRPGIAALVFSALASAGVNILMISQSVSEANISMIVRRSSIHTAERTLKRQLKKEGIEVVLESDSRVAVVAAVGAGMRGEKGVAARVFGAVAGRGINVRMIAQGSSEMNISFVVDERDADEAVRAIHMKAVQPKARKKSG